MIIEIDLKKIERGTHIGRVKVTRGGKTFWRKQRVGVKEETRMKIEGALENEKRVWNRTISKISDKELANVNGIVFSNTEDFIANSGGYATSRDSSFFHHGNKMIYINGEEVAMAGNLSEVIRHEIGHSIEPIITLELRGLVWGGIYYPEKFSKISTLAAMDESQGFAEAYRMYRGSKSDYNKLMSISPESIDFFNNLKFKIEE